MGMSTEYPYFHIHNEGEDINVITRESATKDRSLVLIARGEFYHNHNQLVNADIVLPGHLVSVKFIYFVTEEVIERRWNDQKLLLGERVTVVELKDISNFCRVRRENDRDILEFFRMPPSFIAVVECQSDPVQEASKRKVEEYVNSDVVRQRLVDIISKFSPAETSYVLFSSENEEKAQGGGLYRIPNVPDLPFAGIEGIRSIIRYLRLYNDVGHPLCDNVRDGNWLIEYWNDRFRRHRKLKEFADEFSSIAEELKKMYRPHIPSYFCDLTNFFSQMIRSQIHARAKDENMCIEIPLYSYLVEACYQFLNNLPNPTQKGEENLPTMAAGLPYFANGWTRSWGRETFIAFKGVYLISGLYQEGRKQILNYASVLRHGLIPNIFDQARNPRYNSRDSVWWFLKAIVDYIELSDDAGILEEEIDMVFLSNDQVEHIYLREKKVQKKMKLYDIVQNIFQSHASGIKFREWNAGPRLDTFMQWIGFEVNLKLDLETGFIYGGNNKNCLTWMDKMGSSHKAKNAGLPATPRDGAPIELTALLKFAVSNFSKLHARGVYPYEGVTVNQTNFTFEEWEKKIQDNFERLYFVPSEARSQLQPHQRKTVYRDVIGATDEKEVYRLRPNVCVAMSVASELFVHEHAVECLKIIQENLVEERSLGIKTLYPQDPLYVSYYDYNDDTTHFKVAQGFSYHNGPEWVWLFGHFLIAKLRYDTFSNTQFLADFASYTSNHMRHVETNDWRSLPQLTNHNSEYCKFANKSQASSVACLLEAFFEARGKDRYFNGLPSKKKNSMKKKAD
eukprot:TRINITY_DN2467_c0_g4_i2.p1 TRINITY_DN2467_c0_g4~~TRINITY_DN2467_c0_g4_i2.p1  ORF type:complete len:791 (+),score=167.00 TRINITY_DN2467_c0_g4_i2:1-2373(+)